MLDAGNDKISGKFDLVFSNASIQWIPDHEKLFTKFRNTLLDNGLLAVQIPLFRDMPLGKAISGIAENKRWSNSVSEVSQMFTIHSITFYHDLLSHIFQNVELWETSYMHIPDSQRAILEMIRSTGLKPYLEKLNSDTYKQDFENEVFKKIQNDYPVQKNGNVIFPFKRLFFIARK